MEGRILALAAVWGLCVWKQWVTEYAEEQERVATFIPFFGGFPEAPAASKQGCWDRWILLEPGPALLRFACVWKRFCDQRTIVQRSVCL